MNFHFSSMRDENEFRWCNDVALRRHFKCFFLINEQLAKLSMKWKLPINCSSRCIEWQAIKLHCQRCRREWKHFFRLFHVFCLLFRRFFCIESKQVQGNITSFDARRIKMDKTERKAHANGSLVGTNFLWSEDSDSTWQSNHDFTRDLSPTRKLALSTNDASVW